MRNGAVYPYPLLVRTTVLGAKCDEHVDMRVAFSYVWGVSVFGCSLRSPAVAFEASLVYRNTCVVHACNKYGGELQLKG